MADATGATRAVTAPATAGRLLCLIAIGFAAYFSSRGILDEGVVSMHGDAARYVMNGVFLLDFLQQPSWSIDGILTFAQQYFARYPALSLGHHPPVLPLSLVPFYAVFGVSIFSARLALVTFFLVGTWLFYVLVRRQYNPLVAGWAALLYATAPSLIGFSQGVLSEMPTVTMIFGTFVALLRFRDTGRLSQFVLFVAMAVLSLATKQLAAFLFPAYVIVLLADRSWIARAGRQRVMVAAIFGLIVIVPIVAATIVMSPYNVGVVVSVLERGIGFEGWREIVTPIYYEHLKPSLGLAALAGLVVALRLRDRRSVLAISWWLSVLAGVFFVTGPYDVERYSIYAVPALCMLAASLLASMPDGRRYVIVSAALAIAVAVQIPKASAQHPVGGGGYEAVAQMVTADRSSPTVLYSASVDTGYFVFFVRKHDPEQRLVVLRSDKLLTTSLMENLSMSDQIESPDEIYALLDRFGTKYVVIEDRPTGSMVLDWLRDAVKGDRFIERSRVPIQTWDRRLRGVDLAVYEYKDAGPAAADAQIDINIPLVGRQIHVRLVDLQHNQH